MSRRLLLASGGSYTPVDPEDPDPGGATWRQITNRTGWTDAGVLGGSPTRTSRMFMTVRTAASAVKVATGGHDASYTAGLSLIHEGTTYPLTFSGSPTAVLDAQYEGAVSDPVDIDVSPGDVIEFRRRASPAYLSATNLRWTRIDGEGNQPGDHLTGTWPATDPVDVNPWEVWYATAPLRVLGAVPEGEPFEAWIISGDSITEIGYQMRAIEAAGKAWTNLGDWGDSVGNVNTWGPQYLPRYGPDSSPWSHAICSYGINDFGFGASVSTLKDRLYTHWTWLRGEQGNPVWQTTLLPSTTSTDDWATTANQSLRTGISAEAIALNDWLRAGASYGGKVAGDVGHPLTGYIEAADVVETSHNSGIWKVGYTNDGGHPTETAVVALAAAVTAWLATI